MRADGLALEEGLNARQTTLVRAILESGSLTLSQAEGLLPGVGRRTLQRDLKRLLELGVVVHVGQNVTEPNRAYRLAQYMP